MNVPLNALSRPVAGACLLILAGLLPLAPARAQTPESANCSRLRAAMWQEAQGLKQAATLAGKPARRLVEQIIATGGPSHALQDKAQAALGAALSGGLKARETRRALKELARQAGHDLEERHHVPRSTLLQDFGPALVAGAPSYARLDALRRESRRAGCRPRL